MRSEPSAHVGRAAPATRDRRVAPPSARTPCNPAGPSPAPRRRAAPPGRGCRRPRITSAPTNQPTASPSSDRAGTTALTTRWMGTKASSSAHHQCRHRAGSHGPDTVSTAASIAIQRGSSRNWDRKVLGCSARSKCHCGAAMPSRPDRQREHGDDARRRVGAEQLPVPAGDQPDQDRERQRQDRDAVGQIDQVGLGGRQHADDVGDGLLQRDPVISGDQRAGDDDREEHRREQRAAGCRWCGGSAAAASCPKR